MYIKILTFLKKKGKCRIECGFVRRVFERLHEKRGLELPNPYSGNSEEGAEKRGIWDKHIKIYKEPPWMREYHEEFFKWHFKRETLAREELERRIEEHSDTPEEALTSLVYMEEKEREIEEKTREAKRSLLAISYLGIAAISTFVTFYYHKVKT